MNVEADITELYSLPLEEFVSARNTLAKRAKAEATAEQAASISSLRKPTTTAWLANQLARADSPTVDELLDLGTDMRAATASRDGARLRELTTRRKELVASLLRAARGRAEQAGYGMSDDIRAGLEETLHAALADPEAGESLRAGRLARGLEHVGFAPVTAGGGSGGGGSGGGAAVISLNRARSVRNGRTTGATAGNAGDPDEAADPAAAGSAGRRRRRDDRQRRRDEAAGELDQAQSAVATADDRVDDLTTELDRRRQQLDDAEAAVERLTGELEAARRDVDRALGDVEAGRTELGDAQRDAEGARARRRSAKQNLARVDGE